MVQPYKHQPYYWHE